VRIKEDIKKRDTMKNNLKDKLGLEKE